MGTVACWYPSDPICVLRLLKYGHIELLPYENARDVPTVLSPDAPKSSIYFYYGSQLSQTPSPTAQTIYG